MLGQVRVGVRAGSDSALISKRNLGVELCLSAEFRRRAHSPKLVAIANLAKSSGKPPLIFNLCEWGWVSVDHAATRTIVATFHSTLRVRYGSGESSLDNHGA